MDDEKRPSPQSKPASGRNRQYRVGIIGRTGRGDYGHSLELVWKTLPRVTVVAVADEQEAGARAAASRAASSPDAAVGVFTDYRKMLREAKPDIVAIGPRWADCHAEMVLACAEMGASVYLEKPFTRSLEEADRVLDACQRAHVKLQLAHQIRLSPLVHRVRERIEAGDIGQLLEMRGRGKEDHRAGGEDLLVLGTHILDLMRIFAGDPKWAFGSVQSGGEALAPRHVRDGNEGLGLLAGDRMHAVYGFDRGVHGTFESKATPDRRGQRFGLDLYGTEGIFSIRAGMEPKVFRLRSPSWAPQDGAHWESLDPAEEREGSTDQTRAPAQALSPPDRANQRMALDLLQAIEEDREPAAGPTCGRWTIEMALAIYASARQGRPVGLPLVDRSHPLAGWRQNSG